LPKHDNPHQIDLLEAAVLTVSPLVSILLPAYNVAPWISTCLDSLLAQDFIDFEIIIVDDGSTDGTSGIIQNYAAADNRIRAFSQPNEGVGVARNSAIDHAAGRYIAFVDPDDLVSPDLLSSIVSRAETVAADIVAFPFQSFHESPSGNIMTSSTGLRVNLLPPHEPFSRRDLPEAVLLFSAPHVWQHLFSRSLLDRHDLRFASYPASSDVPFTFTALALAERITTVRRPLYLYRVREGSIQRSDDRDPLEFMEAFIALKRSLEDRGVMDDVRVSYNSQMIRRFNHEASKYPTGDFRRKTVLRHLRERGFADTGIANLRRTDVSTHALWRKYLDLRQQ
jgi:glycosyltransferase EpsH